MEDWIDPSDLTTISYEDLSEYSYKIEELESTISFHKEVCEDLIQTIEEVENEEATVQDLFDFKNDIKKDLDNPNI